MYTEWLSPDARLCASKLLEERARVGREVLVENCCDFWVAGYFIGEGAASEYEDGVYGLVCNALLESSAANEAGGSGDYDLHCVCLGENVCTMN